MTDVLLIERDDAIATWTINLPEQRNPISGAEVIAAFEAAVAAANADPALAAIILTGAGSAFSAGGNVHDMVAKEALFAGNPMQIRAGYESGIQRIPRALARLTVPIIAAVNGPAVGAGCDLACMCDLRVASSTAFFAESFVKLGIIPGDGGAWFLPRAVGAARAAEMAFTGDRVDAATALDWGLVSRVFSPDELLAGARDLAGRIAVNPTTAVRLAKKLLNQAEGQPLDAVLELSAAYQALAHHSPEHQAALAEFTNQGR